MSCLCDVAINNTLLLYLLERIEKNPNGMYSEAELRKISSESFEVLCDRGILKFHVKLKEFDSYYSNLLGDGDTDRIIQKDGDQYYAVAVGVDRIPLTEADLIYWRFDALSLAKMINEKNGLSSDSEIISKRIIYVGTESVDNAAVYLCLFSNDNSAARELSTLDIGNHSSAVLLCPAFNIAQKIISALKINAKAMTFADAFDNEWMLRLGAQRKTKHSTQQRYKTNYTLTFIDYTGELERYPVQIDRRASIDIPYSKYVLLLFLAIKLKEGQGGWVSRAEIEQGKIADGENINHVHNLISELRDCFRGVISKQDIPRFIENIRGKSQYRISTTPNNIYAPHTKWLKQKYNALINQVKHSRQERKKQAKKR
ncbi:MAG: hypothetical protein KKH94_07205 [Candidatus Omnitrophica bacterium]|nr:hypothetical protein [Candidatus Omnitrophota bacterium]